MNRRRQNLRSELAPVMTAEQSNVSNETKPLATVEDKAERIKLREQLAPVLAHQAQLTSEISESLAAMEREAERVAKIMYSAPGILQKLDRQFCEVTGLTRTDLIFLFIATGLQCLRQYVLSNDKFRLTSNEGDELVEKAVPKSWQDILLGSVPYDATVRTEHFKLKYGSSGLGGTTHRYRTLGHDPLFGWVFGPTNIITDSLTKTDFITTYKVIGMKIYAPYSSSTIGMINDSIDNIVNSNILLPVAVIRQALHFGSDYFTKQGLPIPVIGSLNNDLAQTLVTKYNIDMYSVTRGVALSILINTIIQYVHYFLYDPKKDINRDLYEVRTRKILSYSNVIASTSNIIYVAANGYLGNLDALRKLDVGGLLVTIYRIVSDYRYTAQIKKEFLQKEFFKLVMNP
jgi:hypothetical protein